MSCQQIPCAFILFMEGKNWTWLLMIWSMCDDLGLGSLKILHLGTMGSLSAQYSCSPRLIAQSSMSKSPLHPSSFKGVGLWCCLVSSAQWDWHTYLVCLMCNLIIYLMSSLEKGATSCICNSRADDHVYHFLLSIIVVRDTRSKLLCLFLFCVLEHC